MEEKMMNWSSTGRPARDARGIGALFACFLDFWAEGLLAEITGFLTRLLRRGSDMLLDSRLLNHNSSLARLPAAPRTGAEPL